MCAKALVPIDGSEASTLGRTEAIELAKSQGGTLRLIHIVNESVMTSGYGSGIGVAQLIDGLRESGQA